MVDELATSALQTSGGEATAKTGTESSNGSGTVAPENPQGKESIAGGERSSSEGGKENGTDPGRPRFKSKAETIYELRQQLRERDGYWNNEVGTMKQQLAELQKLFDPNQNRKPSRTFYDAPEDTLREILRNELEGFRPELLKEIRQTEEERAQAASLKQEALEAAKFIRSQKGITEEDIQEIREILASDPLAGRIEAPMEQAEYVLYKWEKSRGVSDKSVLKNKAASVAGTSASASGPRIWTEPEMEAELKKIGDVRHLTPDQNKKFKELESEFMRAYAEKRVKK